MTTFLSLPDLLIIAICVVIVLCVIFVWGKSTTINNISKDIEHED